ncbi:MAG: glycoside hydrolase family 5 protein, partial [Ruminococcus sp.]|nr:glycoside hydrolase family 5 protein [Ruminococcus sp.]
MKLKKIAALLTAAVMSVGVMASCDSGSKDDKSKADSKAQSAAETSEAEGGEGSEVPVSETHTNDPMTVTSAKDLVAKMSNGWNLGNTMDATGEGLESEISWLPTKV